MVSGVDATSTGRPETVRVAGAESCALYISPTLMLESVLLIGVHRAYSETRELRLSCMPARTSSASLSLGLTYMLIHCHPLTRLMSCPISLVAVQMLGLFIVPITTSGTNVVTFFMLAFTTG